MPAIDVEEARSINKRVRAAFKRGYKSSNKVYSLRTEEDAIDYETLIQSDAQYQAGHQARLQVLKRYAKAGLKVSARARRNQNAFEASKRRKPLTTYSATAKALQEIPELELAGNCSEMAIYAAAIVSEEHKDAQAFTYIVKLASPSDHLFCVVAKDPGPKEFYYYPSYQLTKPKYSDWVVIDPWLNVCCLMSNYYQQAAKQLQKWADSGKRILWREKFYLPTGSYKESFTNSGMTFDQFR